MSTRVFAAIAAGVQLLAFVPMAVFRNIDADEGYYGLAAQLVGRGETPYHDFFWPQMPLFPYVYGGWTAVIGHSLASARALSVLIAMAIGLVLALHVRRRFGSWRLGLLATVLFASSSLAFDWLVTGKAYGLATLLLLGAVVLVDDQPPVSSRRWLGAGVLSGLAIDARLLFAGGAVVLLVAALRRPVRGWGWTAAARAFLGGLAAGLLPSLVLFALGPKRFLFDNLGYHAVQNGHGYFEGVRANVEQKLRLLAELLAHEPQLVLLVLGALAGTVAARRAGRRVPLAVPVACLLGLAAISPEPAYVQDFSTLVPFLVLGSVELLAVLGPRLSGTSDPVLRGSLRAVLVAAVGLYVLAPVLDVAQETKTGDLTGGFLGSTLRMPTARDVTRAIDARAAPGETVLAFWPGHLVGSHADPVPGFENDFAVRGVEFAALSPADARRHHLASATALEGLIRGHGVRLIAHGPLGDASPRRDWRRIIVASGYRPVARFGLTTLYGGP